MKNIDVLKRFDLSGRYEVTLSSGNRYKAYLPGTLEENRIGGKDVKLDKWHPDADLDDLIGRDIITTRFTRRFVYSGKAWYKRAFCVNEDDLYELTTTGKQRAFIYVERSRKLDLYVNDEKVPPFIEGTLSTAYVFEVTEVLKKENVIAFCVDNNYQDWPADSIKYSSQGTNETQTNWNGVLGRIEFFITRPAVITNVSVYPGSNWVDVRVDVDSLINYQDVITLESYAFAEECVEAQKVAGGSNTYYFNHIPLKSDVLLWDEYQGNMYSIKVYGNELDSYTTNFGIRTFSNKRLSYFTLNDRRVFLRGETNCAVFPETGYVPLDKWEWFRLLEVYKDYGINFIRFHSYCPPDAAFEVCDTLGIMAQVELSCWNPHTCLETASENDYYMKEVVAILHSYANHPSFVMLSLGNESGCSDEGLSNMHMIMDVCRNIDSTRLYTCASNAFYGKKGADSKSDFYTASNYREDMLRGCSASMAGFINNVYPNSRNNYDSVLEIIKKEYDRPVMSFEVGQYQCLPSFEEIGEFRGITIPDNYRYVEKRAKDRGLDRDWDERVNASLALSSLCYREEIEAALRTRDMGGLCLLGLQDFPGQGTAVVGFVNSHGRVKPYFKAEPSVINKQFSSVVPLLLMDKYVYTNQESLHFIVQVANYGREDICDKVNVYLKKNGSIIDYKGFGRFNAEQGVLSDLCEGYFDLYSKDAPCAYTIELEIGGYTNSYNIWVYEDNVPEYKAGETYGNVRITSSYNESIILAAKGYKVLVCPDATEDNFKGSIKSEFSTDFWSKITFKSQSGYMGLIADRKHRIFREFPTESYADWQWWALTKNARAAKLQDGFTPIVKAIDSYVQVDNLYFIAEKDNTVITSLGLLQKQQYVEVRSLIKGIIDYLNGL